MRSVPKSASTTRAQALEALFSAWRPEALETEEIPLEEACGRVLARDMHALLDLPVVRASMMDGVCVDASRFAGGCPDTSGWKREVDYDRADTGDDFPDAFDAVIPIEQAAFGPGGTLTLSPEEPVVPGLHVRPRGSTLRTGDLLMRGGLPIRGVDLAALAMGGVTAVPVYRRPRVAFFPTGSELVPVGAPVTRGKNIDSNSLLAREMLREMGAQPLCHPVVPDRPEALERALETGLAEADVVILNGGSSKGEEDFNARLLEREGQVICHWLSAGPGRPMCIALVRGKPVINLSGPSMAAFYGLDWCIRPIVARLLGLPAARRQRVSGVLAEDLHCPPSLDFLCRMNVRPAPGGGYTLHPVPFKTASLPLCMGSNATFVSPIGEGPYPKGTVLEVELLRDESLLDR